MAVCYLLNVRSVSLFSLVLLALVAFVAISDWTSELDLSAGDEAAVSACDGDEVVITPSATLLPPPHPAHDFRFEPPLQAGRLVVHDVFRPPTSLSVS